MIPSPSAAVPSSGAIPGMTPGPLAQASAAPAASMPQGPQALGAASNMAVQQVPPFFVTDLGGPKAEGGVGKLDHAISTLVPAPNSASDPMQVLASQMALMEAMMSWEFASQVASKVDSGVQSLFNSQV